MYSSSFVILAYRQAYAFEEKTSGMESLIDASELARVGKSNEALLILEQAKIGAELKPISLLLKAQILDRANESCWSVYERAMNEFPHNSLILLRAGAYTMRRGDLDLAERLLLESWELNMNPETSYLLGRIFQSTFKREKALRYFGYTILLSPAGESWRAMALEKRKALSREK